MLAGLLHVTKNRTFSCVLYAYSQFLCSLARFDLASRPVQPRTFYNRIRRDILAQPDFAVVNCSDVVMSVFYSPVSMHNLIFLQL